MTRTNSCMIALALATFVSASATTPSVAVPMSNAAALRAAATDDVTQIRQRSRRGWNRAYRYGPFFGAYGYSRGWGYGGYGGSNNSPAATGGGSLGYNRGIYAN
jgi:hypothetical protein